MRDSRPENPTWITTGTLRKSFYAPFDAIMKNSGTQEAVCRTFVLGVTASSLRFAISIASYLRPTTKSQKHGVYYWHFLLRHRPFQWLFTL